MDFRGHVRDFEEHRRLRSQLAEHWPSGGALDPAIARSLQRLQVGESGDGANLIAKSERAGDPHYLAAVRLFVAEEQNHARLLAEILRYAGHPTIERHWTDTVFVAVRRALGLRLELMTLMAAEVVALRYYRALRDGTRDDVVAGVADRILADEHRHVPFHVDRLRCGFADTPAMGRLLGALAWWALMAGTTLVVAVDHGPALRALGVGRCRFVADVLRLFRPIVPAVFADGAGRRGSAEPPRPGLPRALPDRP